MFVSVDFSLEEQSKPILKPKHSPLWMYLVNAWSGCIASALDHSCTDNGVEIILIR